MAADGMKTTEPKNVALEENNLDYIGCDHTSTKAPDPIRTPKLSVLGRE